MVLIPLCFFHVCLEVKKILGESLQTFEKWTFIFCPFSKCWAQPLTKNLLTIKIEIIFRK
jgi:hypothetical protein